MRILALLPILASFLPRPDAEPKLVVHEWGTFTSVAGVDGTTLEWRPLSGPSDLPSFVYADRHPDEGRRLFQPTHKGDMALVRMETPVLYFYADEEMTVSARVDFPQGRVTEWYPQALSLEGGVDWGSFTVQPAVEAALPHDGTESHYYPARAVSADLVRVCDAHAFEYERFLFYRGVGNFETSARFGLDGDVVNVIGATPGATVVLFERQGDRVGHVVAKGTTVARPQLDGSVDAVVADLERLLVAEGLYVDEAKAMTATWRDSWFEDGLRALWLLPQAETDAILPLHVTPVPDELVRVMVGRVELVPPETREALLERIRAVPPDGDSALLEALVAEDGRFTEAKLRAVHAEAGEAERVVIDRLLTLAAFQTPG